MARIKLVGTGVAGNTVTATVPEGQLIYDHQGRMTVDPLTLKAGDMACVAHGCGGFVLTAAPETVSVDPDALTEAPAPVVAREK